MNMKRLLIGAKQKLFKKRIRNYRKNYMSLHIDEVHIQKVYRSNWPFYLKLVFIPSIITVAIALILAFYQLLSEFVVSIVLGILGSYIASVIVTWLADINACKAKTIERMRFQQVYFHNLLEICGGFIYFHVTYLANNFSNECKLQLENSKKDYQYFRGHPWQYWCAMLEDSIQRKYPFEISVGDNLSGEWISEESALYSGIAYDVVKPDIEKETENFFSTFFEKGDFLDRAMTTITSYRSSLSNVYVNDYIYNLQLHIVSELTDYIEKYIACVREKKYVDFWHTSHRILLLINALSRELYPFRDFRENENVYHITYNEKDEGYVTFDVLKEIIDDRDDPSYSYVRRSEYRKLKKQLKINKRFDSENRYTLDNGWR